MISLACSLWKSKLFRIMRIMCFLLIVGMVSAFAEKAHSQAVRFSLNLRNVTTKTVLQQIEEQSQYYFIYDASVVDVERKTNISAEDQSIVAVLDQLFSQTDVIYKINDRTIALSSTSIPQNASQTIGVSGKVTGDDGVPLPGVTVVVKGSTNGTITDAEGNYNIPQVDGNGILHFSFVGMKPQDVSVQGRTVINVVMAEEAIGLDEVVAIGYGTQSRQNLTGSIAKVSNEILEKKQVSTIESALQGEVSGVSVVNNGGPGVSPTVRIRGIGSVNFNADPLYVVDGLPVGNLNNFDIKDMESVTVLKDAASAAIYGSRAANGVIIITTKQGARNNKMTVSVDASTGIQKAWNMLDLLNRDEYLQFGTELLTNAGDAAPPRFSQMNEPIYEGTTQTFAQTETDWQDEMFRTAPISQLNVNISGGNDKIRLYTSYGRFSQKGIMLGTDYNRHSFRVNTESKVSDRITVGENVKATYSERSNQRTDGGRTIVKHMVNQVPYIPAYDPTKTGGFGGPETVDGSDAANPLRIATFESDKTDVVNLLGNVFAEVRLTDWLKFRSSVGMEYTSDRNVIKLPIYNEGYNQRVDNELTDNRFTYFSPIFTNQLTFNHAFGNHLINAVLVSEQQKTKRTVLNGYGKQATNDLTELTGSTAQTVDGYKEETALISYAGRLNYSFASKYLFNFSIRRDGSSVFAPGKKWGYFPGVSVGWVISEEGFMDNVNVISNLKLKASYGTLGFNAVGAYPWQSSISSNTTAVFNNNYENNPGAYFDKLPNKDLEWEITKMTNFGFDLELLEGSVSFSAEYFERKTDNLIVNNPLPTSMGYAVNPATNIGSMKNWGYEFNAGYHKSFGELNLSVDGNISFVDNKVLKLSTGQPNIDMGGVTSDYGGYTITRTQEGYPIQGFYGWVVDDIFQSQPEIDALNADSGGFYQSESTAPGDIKFKDINGRDANGELTGKPDGKITDDDRTYIGSYLPDFSYGVNILASYKGFDISVALQGVQGNEIYNGTKVLTQGMMRLFNMDKAVLNAWTPENTNTDIPRAVNGDPNHNARTSDRFVEDGSYLRVKNLTLGYTFSPNMMSSISKGAVSSLRLYFTAQNLLTFTKYNGYDPEIGASSTYSGTNATLLQGVDFGFYPQPRTFIFGINVSF